MVLSVFSPAKTAIYASLLLLAACDGGATATPKSEKATTSAALTTFEQADARDAPVPQLDGKPIWTASRRYTAEENVQRAFERNGEDFGAKSPEDFARIARDFVENPPKGVETLKRTNGDTLIYDAKDNVFAVSSKHGTPRTLFRPREGKAYWAEQKAKEAERSTRLARRDRGQAE
ncbi:hypothetical protein P7B02_07950 [Caulobacter segnis]|uniref:hypothetical protein n=1 Tax=Caulobacter segnis TaxID=88688 RepID=UPI00240EFACA|nr:hypothetical protein [Caulobacter segnis]MDG2521472.1 hypothetical protein [Caulobacter segnis]